jgi:predicted acyl esterase
VRRVVLVLSLLALWAAPAWGASGTVTMDDGVRLAYDLELPSGPAPAGGRPGVVVMHGLGGSKDSMAPVARFFAAHGFASLAFTVRGAAGSQGAFGLAGPRDVADMRAMVDWLERRPDVSDRIGCFGISLGGGECWNATPGGTFDAVVPVATWTNLRTALWPGGVARSGVLASLASSVPASLLGQFGSVTGAPTPRLVAALAQRSVAQRLPSIRTPVYLMQGRADYVFDLDQATAAFARLAGPKKLYVGDFGHPPATFASPDFPSFVLDQSVRWFDRYLRGERNGIERPAVVLADRTGRRRASFARLPRTHFRRIAFDRRGTARAPAAIETFGDSTVRVRVDRVARSPRLVAVLLADGKVVSHGAVVPHRGTNTIRLADYAVYVPRGARLRLRLGPDGGTADPAYFGFGATGSIALGPATLSLRTLLEPVSR